MQLTSAHIPVRAKLGVAAASLLTRAPFATLQRRCACGGSGSLSGECAECKKRKTLQRRVDGHGDSASVPLIVHDVLRTTGRPLDSDSRAFFEPRFGQDFSRVRIHDDKFAAESARAVGAVAYAVGAHIVFDRSYVSGDSSAGKRLLAHELVHVVQQSAFKGSTAQMGEGLIVEPSSSRLEMEARQSESVIMNESTPWMPRVAAGSVTANRVQRQEAPPPAQEEQRLRGLARRPSAALKTWRTLNPAGRSFVLITMTGLYGPDFSLKFTEYANGKKKPEFFTEVSQANPKSLLARGFRYAGDPGGIPLWVHPSGAEAMILSGGGSAPSPSGEPPERTPEEVARCERTCSDIDDEDACNQCCEERIPETDSPCRTNCKSACATKL